MVSCSRHHVSMSGKPPDKETAKLPPVKPSFRDILAEGQERPPTKEKMDLLVVGFMHIDFGGNILLSIRSILSY